MENVLGTLCSPYMRWYMSQRSSNMQGTDITLGRSSELNTLSGVHSCSPGRKEIHSGMYGVSTVLPVDVSKATLPKQADF
jgi:hypothetical protein